MNKLFFPLLAAALLAAGCGRMPSPQATAPTGSLQALKQDRRPAGPVQSAMDDLTYLKMVDLDRSGTLDFDEFKLLGVFPALHYGMKVQTNHPTAEDISRKVFHDWDKNDDQKLTTREFKELGNLIAGFIHLKSLSEVVYAIDMDDNDALTLREWKALGIFGVHRKTGDKPRPLTEWLVDTFDQLDANNDGQLKGREQRMVWQTMWYDGKPWLQ